MIKILVFHGLGSGANNGTSKTIKAELGDLVEVYAPEVPHDPLEAYQKVKEIEKEYQPDLIAGISMGGFYTMSIDTPAKKLLINPAMQLLDNLYTGVCKGCIPYTQEFSKKRSNPKEYWLLDGKQMFTLDKEYMEKIDVVENLFKNQVFLYEDKNKTAAVISKYDEHFTRCSYSNYDYYKKLYNENVVLIDEEDAHHKLESKQTVKYVIPKVKELLNI